MNLCKSPLTAEPLDVAQLGAIVAHPSCGAELVFVGRVRENNEGKPVSAVSYDAFAPLVVKTLDAICAEVAERFGPDVRIAAVHRVGRLEVGEPSLVVAVAAPHRGPVFDASRYAVEQVKARVPVWKLEHYVDGDGEWLAGKALVEGGA